MFAFFEGWLAIALFVGFLVVGGGLTITGIIDTGRDAAAMLGFGMVALFFATVFGCYCFCNNWDLQKVEEYEKVSSRLAEKREYCEKEHYSSLKSAAYLKPYIADSLKWADKVKDVRIIMAK